MESDDASESISASESASASTSESQSIQESESEVPGPGRVLGAARRRERVDTDHQNTNIQKEENNEGSVLGANRSRHVRTGDESTLVGSGVGSASSLGLFGLWEAWRKRRREKKNDKGRRKK